MDLYNSVYLVLLVQIVSDTCACTCVANGIDTCRCRCKCVGAASTDACVGEHSSGTGAHCSPKGLHVAFRHRTQRCFNNAPVSGAEERMQSMMLIL